MKDKLSVLFLSFLAWILTSCSSGKVISLRTTCSASVSYSTELQDVEDRSKRWDQMDDVEKAMLADSISKLSKKDKLQFLKNREVLEELSNSVTYNDQMGGLLDGLSSDKEGGILGLVTGLLGGVTDSVSTILDGLKDDRKNNDDEKPVDDIGADEDDGSLADNDDTSDLENDENPDLNFEDPKEEEESQIAEEDVSGYNNSEDLENDSLDSSEDNLSQGC